MAKAKPFKFAHFFGGPRATEEDEEKSKKARKAKSRAEDDDRKDDAEDDEDDVDAEDDDRKDDAEDDEDDVDAEEDDDSDPEDDDGDDRKDSKASRQARQAERRRCARIFASRYAAGNVALAASLAFDTGMSSSAAIAVLKGNSHPQSSGAKKVTLDERMSRIKNHQLGNESDSRSDNADSVVSRATALYNKVKGKK